jgi:multidrug efflux pump subunit AcrA (membrane-fusion protein)
MRFFGRSMIGLFLMALTLGLLSLAGMLIYGAVTASLDDGGPEEQAGERVVSAAVVTVEPTQITPKLTVFGEVRSQRTLELRAPRAGRIVWLDPAFADGASVTAGQLLLRLDDADAVAALSIARTDATAAKAEMQDAAAALILAQDDLTAAQAQAALRAQALLRQRDLQERQLGSIDALETAELAASSEAQAVLSRRSALAVAKARVSTAAAEQGRQAIALAEAERALRDTSLLAEFDGVVSDVLVVEGRLVGVNERLADLIDATALEVSFRVSTAQFVRLIDADGSLMAAPLTASLDVLGAEISVAGRLTRVAASVGEGQSGRQVYATLDIARGLRPGDFVTVSIAEPALNDVALVPAAAVDAADEVLALGPEDRLQAVAVDVLRRQGNDLIISASALAGREIVAERSPLLGAGIRIKPLRAGLPEPTEDAAELIDLTPERRAKLIAFVQSNTRMPEDAKARVMQQLAQEQVPAEVIARLEQRMGG